MFDKAIDNLKLKMWLAFLEDWVGEAAVTQLRREFETSFSHPITDLLKHWDRVATTHGVRNFTGNDHRLFANELRAALIKEKQYNEGS